MKLKALRLNQFRNYGELELSTEHRVNLFIGPNAQGKTNLLEAIHALALTKSHRTNRDREMIRWNSDAAVICGELDRKHGECRLELFITHQGKKARLNGLEQRKLSSFIGVLNVVMFAPEDLEIVKGSPRVRRRFLDMELSQIAPAYVHLLTQYHQVLMQRNRMLKQAGVSLSGSENALMDVWNEQLARYGTKIMQRRQNFIKKLEIWAERIHSGITGGAERLGVAYRPSFETADFDDEATVFEQFMIKLSQVKDMEFRRGTSLVGPHRDDLVFFINGKEAQIFGSQGQQRTAALSLKLAEIELITEETGDAPVLLLDDVLSELDRERQTQLIETFQSKVQTFITATGVETVSLERLEDARLFRVTEGRVVPG